MDKTLAFIERLGRDAQLGAAPESVLAAEARAAGVAPDLAAALARRDPFATRQLLAAVVLSLGLALPATGWCNIATPNDPPAEGVPEGEPGEGDPEEATAQQPRSAPAQQPEPVSEAVPEAAPGSVEGSDSNEAPAAEEEEEEESAEEEESFHDEDSFDEEEERR